MLDRHGAQQHKVGCSPTLLSTQAAGPLVARFCSSATWPGSLHHTNNADKLPHTHADKLFLAADMHVMTSKFRVASQDTVNS